MGILDPICNTHFSASFHIGRLHRPIHTAAREFEAVFGSISAKSIRSAGSKIQEKKNNFEAPAKRTNQLWCAGLYQMRLLLAGD
jgi:hypothetical protein